MNLLSSLDGGGGRQLFINKNVKADGQQFWRDRFMVQFREIEF